MRDKASQAYQLLQLIAISGELPAESLYRLDGGEHYREKFITGLKNDKLIRTYYKDKLRGYRLTMKAKKILLSDNYERFSFYLDGCVDTNQIRSEITRRLRLHRLAETYLTMMRASIVIYIDDKPGIFHNYGDVSEPSQTFAISTPAFYTSREFKNLGLDAIKIRNTRSVGVLFSPNTAFIAYNTGSTILKWDYKSEMRAKAMLRNICVQRLPASHINTAINAIMLGATIGLGYDLLTSKGGTKRNYFMLDGNFDSFHYITHDHAGEILLQLLCNDDCRRELNSILLQGCTPPNAKLLIENDGIDGSGNPVLLAYDFDMPRISKFSTALRLQNKQGILICFDYQRDVLSAFCGERVTVQTIDLTKFERRFFA